MAVLRFGQAQRPSIKISRTYAVEAAIRAAPDVHREVIGSGLRHLSVEKMGPFYSEPHRVASISKAVSKSRVKPKARARFGDKSVFTVLNALAGNSY